MNTADCALCGEKFFKAPWDEGKFCNRCEVALGVKKTGRNAVDRAYRALSVDAPALEKTGTA